ncbi:MAG: NAD-dependent epimerase/dehydratase family protein [Acidimicrobiales bacterium]
MTAASGLRVVVTGGAGFIGANLCRRLSGDPAVGSVIAIDDLSTGSAANLADLPGVELVLGTILDADLLDQVFRGAHAVVHLAARPSVPRSLTDPMATHLVNATGTVEVLEAARRAGEGRTAGPLHVVVASSSSVYGANRTLPQREDATPMPLSPYGASKLAAESYALAGAASFGLRVLAFRLFNVFGPFQTAGHPYAAVVPTFIDAALRGRPLTIHGDGRQTRDFTFVGSVIAVLADALMRRVSCERPVNLAFGSRVSLQELISDLEAIFGHPLRVEYTVARVGDIRDSQADQSEVRQLFPDLDVVPLSAGLRSTVNWFRKVADP